jgi:ribokinase
MVRMSERPKIVVVGSLNVDHTLKVPRIPAPGQTIMASGALTSFGGKGANQALAAARAGGDVALIGCVGDDDFGGRYIQHLRAEGIAVEGIVKATVPTGSAFITVDDAGENAIVVNPGANAALEPHHLDTHAAIIRSAAALLLQFECPLPTVCHAVGIAKAGGVPVILNPSPLSPEFLLAGLACDTLIANEHEAAAVAGMSVAELEVAPARALSIARCRELIVTCGGAPTLVIAGDAIARIPPPKVTPVDTVGAGDAFAGAFCVARAVGASLEEAVRFANAAGALATQKIGAQSSIPTRKEITALLDDLPATW